MACAAAVVPEAKYQSGDAVLWHGAWDHPSGLKTDWVTATPPPAVTTLSASHVPEDGAGIAGDTAPSAGTATSVCAVAPVSVTAVTAAVTARAVVLVSTSEPGATPPAVDWPVQYQADDSASGACRRAHSAWVRPRPVPENPAGPRRRRHRRRPARRARPRATGARG